MFHWVVYTVRWGYLVENQREDWQAMEAALSEKLSELAGGFVPVRIELFKDERQYDVIYTADFSITGEQIEAAWDHVWETAVTEKQQTGSQAPAPVDDALFEVFSSGQGLTLRHN